MTRDAQPRRRRTASYAAALIAAALLSSLPTGSSAFSHPHSLTSTPSHAPWVHRTRSGCCRVSSRRWISTTRDETYVPFSSRSSFHNSPSALGATTDTNNEKKTSRASSESSAEARAKERKEQEGEEQQWSFFGGDSSSDSSEYATRDLTQDSFGPLLPVAEKVDELTNGWGLSYADLHPETPQTPFGVAFLATNACYAVGGLALGVRGEWTLGALTEVAGIVSFWYHYSQLEFGQDRREVRLALLIDYMTAGSALVTGGFYMVSLGIGAVPIEAVVWGLASVVCLTLCWVREFGYWYLFWHSLWHVFSAYTGYLVGQAHISGTGGLDSLVGA